jgi:hypothetical protein
MTLPPDPTPGSDYEEASLGAAREMLCDIKELVERLEAKLEQIENSQEE